MKFGLKAEVIEKIKNVFIAFQGINEAILFGSRAKGNHKDGSDIDIALKGSNLKLNDLLRLHNLLDNLELPYKFDLVIFNQIEDKEVTAHIERVGEVIYKNTSL